MCKSLFYLVEAGWYGGVFKTLWIASMRTLYTGNDAQIAMQTLFDAQQCSYDYCRIATIHAEE
jgi:hypothetical protein